MMCNGARWSEALLGGNLLRTRLGWANVSRADIDRIPRDMADLRRYYVDAVATDWRGYDDDVIEAESRALWGDR